MFLLFHSSISKLLGSFPNLRVLQKPMHHQHGTTNSSLRNTSNTSGEGRRGGGGLRDPLTVCLSSSTGAVAHPAQWAAEAPKQSRRPWPRRAERLCRWRVRCRSNVSPPASEHRLSQNLNLYKKSNSTPGGRASFTFNLRTFVTPPSTEVTVDIATRGCEVNRSIEQPFLKGHGTETCFN